MIFKSVYHFFDRFEDKVRGKLSYYPLCYAFIGGAGVILFWRGIWHTMDALMEYLFIPPLVVSSTSNIGLPWWDGPLSVFIGVSILLALGLLVPSFIGNEIIISGIRGEKKLAEKSEQEINEDVAMDEKMTREIRILAGKVEEIKAKLK